METKNNKKTKTALILSTLLIVFSVILLIGSTFAWFTDSATSGKNKIMAGNLDVEIEYAPLNAPRDASSGKIEEGAWQKLGANDSIFQSTDSTLWEPGHTEIAYLRIKNKGTLNLKYNIEINAYGDANNGPENTYTNVKDQQVQLSDYLVFNKVDTVASQDDRKFYWIKDEEKEAMGTLKLPNTESKHLTPNESKELTLVVYMPTLVNNDANPKIGEKPELYFGITVKAVQAEGESDTFDSSYDVGTTY